jgi:fatty acid hydroxylase domain-containing protein 2
MNQFSLAVVDHLMFHWLFVGITFLADWCVSKYNFPYKLHTRISSREFEPTIFNAIFLVLFNQFFVTIPMLYFLPEFPKGDFLCTENLYKIPLVILLVDILFYHLHILFHKFLYEYHKIHHLWIFPIGISATYAHPAEHALVNILPVLLSGWMVGFNLTTMRLWHIFSLFNAIVIAHSGYKISKFHDIHHTSYIHNYGVIGFMDILYGTIKYLV